MLEGVRVLGIDPGSRNCGWAVVDDVGGTLRLVDWGLIKTKGTQPDAMLLDLHTELDGVLCRYQPDELALESLFFARNVSSAIAVAEARGVILLAAAQWQAPASSWTPQQIKKIAAGSGKADKDQVQAALALHLRLPHLPKSSHAADAVGAALCRLLQARQTSTT